MRGSRPRSPSAPHRDPRPGDARRRGEGDVARRVARESQALLPSAPLLFEKARAHELLERVIEVRVVVDDGLEILLLEAPAEHRSERQDLSRSFREARQTALDG